MIAPFRCVIPNVVQSLDWARIRSHLELVTEAILSILIARRNGPMGSAGQSSKWIYSLCCCHFDRTLGQPLPHSFRTSSGLSLPEVDSADIYTNSVPKMHRSAEPSIFCWFNRKSSASRVSGIAVTATVTIDGQNYDVFFLFFVFFHRFIESSQMEMHALDTAHTNRVEK